MTRPVKKPAAKKAPAKKAPAKKAGAARPRAPKSPKHTAGDVAQAITAALGIKSVAARLLGVERSTLDEYLIRYPDARAAYEQAADALVDLGESTVARFVQGRVEDQTPQQQLDAAKFLLVKKGRTRGWGDRVDVTVVPITNPQDLTDDELAALAAGTVPPRLAGAHPAGGGAP